MSCTRICLLHRDFSLAMITSAMPTIKKTALVQTHPLLTLIVKDIGCPCKRVRVRAHRSCCCLSAQKALTSFFRILRAVSIRDEGKLLRAKPLGVPVRSAAWCP